MDDLFVIMPADAIVRCIDALNGINSMIQFTHDIEKDSQLPYLDVLVIHAPDGSLSFKWYSKPTSSNRVLNFLSNHPFQHKLNVVDNLIKRIFGLSSQMYHHENGKLVKTMLIKNGYPLSLIRRRLKNPQTDVQYIEYRGIRYEPSCSVNISRAICGDVDNLRAGFKPVKTVRKVFSNVKQRTELLELANVVYNIPCLGDGIKPCALSYVGQTKNKLGERTDTHMDDIVRYNRTGSLDKQTALVHHFHDGHAPNFDEVSVLASERNWT